MSVILIDVVFSSVPEYGVRFFISRVGKDLTFMTSLLFL